MQKPNQSKRLFQSVFYSFQHLIVALPSTILVALLTGFSISSTLLCCGIANLLFWWITRKRMPLIWGASFAFIPSIATITCAQYGVVSPDHLVATASVGILSVGIVTALIGLIVKKHNEGIIHHIIPPVVSGSIAIVIGVSLSSTAIQNLFFSQPTSQGNDVCVFIGIITLAFAFFFSVCNVKLINRFAIVLAMMVGCIITGITTLWGYDLFNHTYDVSIQSLFVFPHVVFPWQADRSSLVSAIIGILPVAAITLPETIAHVFQADYGMSYSTNSSSSKISLHSSIIGNGIADCLCAALGGPGVTSYGENISVMVIAKDFSSHTLMYTGCWFILFSFIAPLCSIIYCIPKCVIGAISIFLFGMIICQGIGLLINNHVNLSDVRSLCVISVILIIGIGGLFGTPNGMFTIMGIDIPAVAFAAVLGIITNLFVNRS